MMKVYKFIFDINLAIFSWFQNLSLKIMAWIEEKLPRLAAIIKRNNYLSFEIWWKLIQMILPEMFMQDKEDG